MLQKKDRRRAIGVLVENHDEATDEKAVSAAVVWGLIPYTVPKMTAPTEEEAIEKLRDNLRDRHRVTDRPLVFFHDLDAAMDARHQNMLSTMLLSEALSPGIRQNIADALGIDGTEGTRAKEDAHELLEAFDRITETLASVETGTRLGPDQGDKQ